MSKHTVTSLLNYEWLCIRKLLLLVCIHIITLTLTHIQFERNTHGHVYFFFQPLRRFFFLPLTNFN